MLRFLPLAVFLVIFLGVCTPRSVQASCGDWLQHAGPAHHAEQADVVVPTAPAEPCQGPLCRQSPSGSDQLPASPGLERHHHDAACIRQASTVDDLLDAEWNGDAGLFMPVGHKMGIERPPRS